MDSDQYKLSCWWHNDYNKAWYTLDCLREILTTEARVVFCKSINYFDCVIYDKQKEYYGAREDMLEAFMEAYNYWKKGS